MLGEFKNAYMEVTGYLRGTVDGQLASTPTRPRDHLLDSTLVPALSTVVLSTGNDKAVCQGHAEWLVFN